MYALCVEASHARGLGHLFRALALQDRLVGQGSECLFVLNDDSRVRGLLRDRGLAHEVVPLHDAGWQDAILDRYPVAVWVDDRLDTDGTHGLVFARRGVKRVTFDDHGAGAELADLHVAALAFDEHIALGGRRVLRGLDYLVLGTEIARYRRQRSGDVRWLVTMGGSDTHGLTVDVVRRLAPNRRAVTVVVGPAFEHHAALRGVLPEDYVLKEAVPSLAAEAHAHDVAVTAGGLTCFEACACGLPCVAIAAEAHEVASIRALERIGAARFAGQRAAIDDAALLSPLDIKAMSRAGLDGVPTDGTSRICREMESL